MHEERTSARVQTAKQAEEIRSRWSWVEPNVWTDRMLTALENGVKGGVWFSLIDKVYAKATLDAAFKDVKANAGSPGIDHMTVERFAARADQELEKLAEYLKAGNYQPRPIKRVYINKPGSKEKRPLGIATVRDRTVQAAVRKVIEPIFEREFAECSYGFRPGRGCKDALRVVDSLLKSGYHYVVDADLKSYFDTIPHGRLLERVKERIADGRIVALIEGFLKQGVMDGTETWTNEMGTPQGAVVSPLLANIYLNPLDHEMMSNDYKMIRYADDLVILSKTQQEAERALLALERWTRDEGLTLHPQKTSIVNMGQEGAGFDFLGYHFLRLKSGKLLRGPRDKSLSSFRDAIRARTKRNSGQSLEHIIAEVNFVTRGWFEYYKHSHYSTIGRLDGWVRTRLRNILRKRHRGKGRARFSDHSRWPNKYFAVRGLFSMAEAHAAVRQSARR
jgi:RNA-directed DNA polymerase